MVMCGVSALEKFKFLKTWMDTFWVKIVTFHILIFTLQIFFVFSIFFFCITHMERVQSLLFGHKYLSWFWFLFCSFCIIGLLYTCIDPYAWERFSIQNFFCFYACIKFKIVNCVFTKFFIGCKYLCRDNSAKKKWCFWILKIKVSIEIMILLLFSQLWTQSEFCVIFFYIMVLLFQKLFSPKQKKKGGGICLGYGYCYPMVSMDTSTRSSLFI